MLSAVQIKNLFRALNKELQTRKVMGEVGLCGGAVMCLVFQSRASTRNVDGIFEPTREIREAAAAVAQKMDVPTDWLNDAAKGYFHADPPRQNVLDLSNLRVWAPRADYMLAMKCISARFDSHDKEDVLFLIRHLGIKTPGEVFSIVENYYPRQKIPAKARFLVEELMEV